MPFSKPTPDRKATQRELLLAATLGVAIVIASIVALARVLT